MKSNKRLMPTLQLWTCVENVKIDKGTVPITFSAKETLLTCLNPQKPQTGWTIAQMRERLKMLDVLNDATEDSDVELSVDQLTFLGYSLENTQFLFALDNTILLSDKINELLKS